MNCPPADRIEALAGGALSTLELLDLEKHLDQCARCTDLVAAAVSSHGLDTERMISGQPAAPPPTTLGRYLVRRWIGRGGMGDVYEGFDPKLERRVALKLLRDRGEGSASGPRRLEREAKTLARLSHPNVVAALDIGLFGDQVFLVMELVDGPTLSEWLRAAPHTWQEIVDVFLAAGEGLAAAHEVGVIHRDFKPQNVLMGRDGKARVSDFGLAHTVRHEKDADADLSRAGHNADARTAESTWGGEGGGTARYMAPEQAAGQVVDARADQFSFCVSLCEALFGRHPFDGGGSNARREPPVVGPSAAPVLRAKFPRAIHQAVLRGLAPDPAQRFSSMLDLLGVMRAARHQHKLVRRPAAMAVVGALVAAMTIGATTWLGVRHERLRPIEPTGEAEDWSDTPVIFREPQRIQCMTSPAPGVVRVIWGEPRHAEEVVLRTRERRPADLVPGAYRYGCPALSPDGGQLIFEGHDSKERPHIMYAANPQGRNAEPIVPSVAPCTGSEPLWLSNRDFVFDLDSRHAAVFSTEDNTITAIPNRDTEFAPGIGFMKAVSPPGDRIAITHFAEDARNAITEIFRWPQLTLENQFVIRGAAWPRRRFGADPTHLYAVVIRHDRDHLVAFDSKSGQIVNAVSFQDRDVLDLLPLQEGGVAVLTRQMESNIWLRDAGGRERPIMPRSFSIYRQATMTSDGSILATRFQGDAANAFLYRPRDNATIQLTTAGGYYAAAFIAGGSWVVARDSPTPGVFRCPSLQMFSESRCSRILSETPQSMAPSPDGKFLAFTTHSSDRPVVRLMSMNGGAINDLVKGAGGCPIAWSGPTTVWVSLEDGGEYRWVEFDVRSRKPTGANVKGTSGCWNAWEGDGDPPVRSEVRAITTTDWDIRLRAHAAPP